MNLDLRPRITTILLNDDSPDVRADIEIALEAEGNSLLAADGSERLVLERKGILESTDRPLGVSPPCRRPPTTEEGDLHDA